MFKIIISFLFLSLSVVVFFGLPSNLKLVNKYWFPYEIRKYLLPKSFKDGACIESKKHWAVSRKKVIGFSYENNNEGYLLMDMDRYEHMQFIKKEKVEQIASSTFCR